MRDDLGLGNPSYPEYNQVDNDKLAAQAAANATLLAQSMQPRQKTDAELAMEQAKEEQRKQQLKEAEEFEKIRKERIRNGVNDRYETRAYIRDRQPVDQYDKPIGNRGYAWKQNFKAGDGNWYAEYRANVGGSKMRIYAISNQQWLDEYDAGRTLVFKECPNCTNKVCFVRDRSGTGANVINHCPKCNKKYEVSMYGSLYEADA